MQYFSNVICTFKKKVTLSFGIKNGSKQNVYMKLFSPFDTITVLGFTLEKKETRSMEYTNQNVDSNCSKKYLILINI